MRAPPHFMLKMALTAIAFASVAANAAYEHASNKSICHVSFGGSSDAQPISVLQVVVPDGLMPCSDPIVTRIEATLTCSAPALAPLNIWPMFSWKSHNIDSPRYISALDEASGLSGASMPALAPGSAMQQLSIPVLLPPACCGVGVLQVGCRHQKVCCTHT
jgi:hypothetical protein